MIIKGSGWREIILVMTIISYANQDNILHFWLKAA